jgi:hypothetical protein
VKRVLFDENLPRLLKRELPGFEVRTVAEMGWAGIKNGKLLRLAEAEFDILVTADQNLSYQQPVTIFKLGLAVLKARTTKLEDLLPLVPALRVALDDLKEGQVCHVGPSVIREAGGDGKDNKDE